MEQQRWNEGLTNQLFYCGNQSFVNSYYGWRGNTSNTASNLFFNIVKEPVCAFTGYQRQHAKQLTYLPYNNSDSATPDQYTKVIRKAWVKGKLSQTFSQGIEDTAVTGLILFQPYLDYYGDDPAQGDLALKIWQYNSFLVDPYWRQSLDEARYIWCQEYISKEDALGAYPDKRDVIMQMSGATRGLGEFYFLPENQSMEMNNLITKSYIWTRHRGKKNRLYSKSQNVFYDFSEKHMDIDRLLDEIPDFEIVKSDSTIWKLTTVLNETFMSSGENPMGDMGCPLVASYWDYDASIPQQNLRVRSMVTPMRPCQWLFNRRILLNHSQAEGSITTGWKRKENSVANEENLKQVNDGWDIIIKDGYEMTDVEKITPNQVPPSNMELATQLQDLNMLVGGFSLENWTGDDMKQVSAMALMMKQSGQLLVNQKYLDQADNCLKSIGDKSLRLILNKWNGAKIKQMIGEDPTPMFFNGIFAKYEVTCQEGLDTATQQQLEFAQWMELNEALGGIIPPSEMAKRATVQGKEQLMELLAQMEQQQQAVAQHGQMVQHAVEEAKIRELDSKSVVNVATATERDGRSKADRGLFEESLSMTERNRAVASKDTVETALKILEAAGLFGALPTQSALDAADSMSLKNKQSEDIEEAQVDQSEARDEFIRMFMANRSEGKTNPPQGQELQPQLPQMGYCSPMFHLKCHRLKQ